MSWRSDIQDHFKDRRNFTTTELASEFEVVAQEDVDNLLECLHFFEEEYGLVAGTMRASDPLSIFVNPTSGSLKWQINNLGASDSLAELNYQLEIRRRALRRALKQVPSTVGEYVKAWIGSFD